MCSKLGKSSAVFVAIAILAGLPAPPRATAAPPVTIQQVIAVQDAARNRIRSMRVTVKDADAQYVPFNAAAPLLDKPMRETTTSTLAFDMSRSTPCYGRYSTVTHDNPGTLSDPLQVPVERGAVYDGAKMYTFDSQMFRGMYHTTACSQVPVAHVLGFQPMGFGYTVDQRWVSDYLAESPSTVQGEASDPKFGPLVLVRVTASEPSGVLVRQFWFAKNLGYMAIRATSLRSLPLGSQRQETYTVTAVKRVAGVWVATAGSFVQSLIREGQVRPLFLNALSFSNIQVNHVPAGVYELPWRVGDELTDSVDGKRYIYGSTGEWAYLPPAQSAPASIP